MVTLFVTKAEHSLFADVSDALKDGWEDRMKDEKGTAFETPKQLEARMKIVSQEYKRFPKVQEIVEKSLKDLSQGKPLESLPMKEIPHDALMPLLFSLGASGISSLMEVLLRDVVSDEDLNGIAALSQVRHAILESNASLSL